MRASVLRTVQALSEYERPWSALTAPVPGASFAEMKAWLMNCRAGGTPFTIVLTDQHDRIVALAPWLLTEKRGVRTVSGIPQVLYHDPIIAVPHQAQEVAARIVDSLLEERRSWDRIALNLQTEKSASLQTEFRRLLFHREDRTDWLQSPVIRLGDSWEAYWKSRSPGFRQNISRAQRRLEEHSHCFFQCNEEDSAEWLEEILRQYQARMGHLNVDWPAYYAYLRAIARQAEKQGGLYLCGLMIDDRVAALEFAVVLQGQAFGLLRVYDKAFQKYSVGHLLTFWTLQRLLEVGVRRLDFGGGGDWKDSYATDWIETVHVVGANPASPKGAVTLAWQGFIRPWLQKQRAYAALRSRLQAFRDPLPEPTRA